MILHAYAPQSSSSIFDPPTLCGVEGFVAYDPRLDGHHPTPPRGVTCSECRRLLAVAGAGGDGVSMTSDATHRVYRENDVGHLEPVEVVETERFPTAIEVLTALRSFVDQAAPSDLCLLRPEQARVLVERVDATVQGLRQLADRLDTPYDGDPPPPPSEPPPMRPSRARR